MVAMDFKQGADLFTRVAVHAPDAQRTSLERAARIVEAEAKRVIGTYDYGWPPLKDETIARKGADTPLLETGEMRDSIEHYVDIANGVAYVGSNNPKALFHELGTVNIPPRSFLAAAAAAKQREIHAVVKEHYHALWTGRTEHAAHLIHVLEGMIERGTGLIEEFGGGGG